MLPVMIGVNGSRVAALTASGQAMPRPQLARAVIDTGSDITAIDPGVIARLGVPPFRQHNTQTVAGQVSVDLYEVSLSLPPAGRVTIPLLVQDNLIVMGLPNFLPGIDVLLGLDVTDQGLLILDGPRGEGTIAD
jgi:hypothetical protein